MVALISIRFSRFSRIELVALTTRRFIPRVFFFTVFFMVSFTRHLQNWTKTLSTPNAANVGLTLLAQAPLPTARIERTLWI
jgi:hypothetical protein